MSFFSLILALLIEQLRPLQDDNFVYQALRSLTAAIEKNFIVGEAQYGFWSWCLLVLPLSLLTWVIFYLLYRVQPLLGILWNVVVLYVTLGFRQVSHYFTDMQIALAQHELEAARGILQAWKKHTDPTFSAAQLDAPHIARIAIEEALLASHRHVFGVFFWFVILPGPAGAVLYRLADYCARHCARVAPDSDDLIPQSFSQVAQRVFAWIDWIPVRMTAISFAIVGNFEEAIFFWRNYTAHGDQRRIILASGSGALGVRLGDAPMVLESDGSEFAGGIEASPAAMRSTVGLVWRSLVLWMLLLLALSVAGLFG